MPKIFATVTFVCISALMGAVGVTACSALNSAGDSSSASTNRDGVDEAVVSTSVVVGTPRSATDSGRSTQLGLGAGATATGGVDGVGTAVPAPEDPLAAGTRVGAAVWADEGFAALADRRVGLVSNGAARIGSVPVVDVMVAAGVDVVALYAPEHGFDAVVAAGAPVADGVHPVHGIPVHSLYGADRELDPADLAGVEILVFDLQDVGVRAYTYLATMGSAMEAATAADIPFVVLDRPNPLGDRAVEGWIRTPELDSFVSRYPVPAVHGLTAGELALAAGGEGWLDIEGLRLSVVRVDGWDRTDPWDGAELPWHAPSPSLPDLDSVALYPGLVLLEGTSVSVGRGTTSPFTVVGAPWLDGEALARSLAAEDLPGVGFEPTTFTPVATADLPDPPHAGVPSAGVRIVVEDPDLVRPLALGVHVLAAVEAQAAAAGVGTVVDNPELLDLLAGTSRLRQGLAAGRTPTELSADWAADVERFAELRRPYLLYD